MATLGSDAAVKFLTNSKEPPKWNATKNQYEKTVKKQHNKIMRYPMDIISASTDYIKIETLKHTGKGSGFGQGEMFTGSTSEIVVGKSGENDVAIKGMKGGSVKEINKTLHNALADITIMLPIPQNIGDSNSVGWGRNEINDWQAWGADVAMKASTVDNFAGFGNALTTAGKLAFDDMSESPGSSAIDIFKAKLIASGTSIFGGNVTAQGILGRTTGQIINSNVELLFNSVTLRAFTFNWNLSPRDEKEAQVVKNIIRTLKQKSAAKRDPDKSFGFLNAPDLFRISYMSGSGKHKFLNSFKHCALGSMNVNYTASGTYATYEDGTPVHMQLGLTFQELNPIYAEDYDDSHAGEGVGF